MSHFVFRTVDPKGAVVDQTSLEAFPSLSTSQIVHVGSNKRKEITFKPKFNVMRIQRNLYILCQFG